MQHVVSSFRTTAHLSEMEGTEAPRPENPTIGFQMGSSTRREVAASRRTQGPGGDCEAGEADQGHQHASAITHRQVGGCRSCVVEDQAGGGYTDKNIVDRVPMGRFATPEDAAQAVAFFADPEQSAFVNGHTLSR
jgi:hypothetical protein